MQVKLRSPLRDISWGATVGAAFGRPWASAAHPCKGRLGSENIGATCGRPLGFLICMEPKQWKAGIDLWSFCRRAQLAPTGYLLGCDCRGGLWPPAGQRSSPLHFRGLHRDGVRTHRKNASSKAGLQQQIKKEPAGLSILRVPFLFSLFRRRRLQGLQLLQP